MDLTNFQLTIIVLSVIVILIIATNCYIIYQTNHAGSDSDSYMIAAEVLNALVGGFVILLIAYFIFTTMNKK